MKKRFDILTLFPDACEAYTNASILGRAQKNKLIDIHSHQLRDFSADKKHQRVDDSPYGGGPGMVMQVEPFDRALRKIKAGKDGKAGRAKKTRVILTSASGKRFTQADARRLAKFDQLIFLCGRYEGIDARVEEYLADESLSIGDYVLTGGELPAMVMIDAISRMIPGVLGKEASLDQESHTQEGVLEYPQYTKPEVYTFKGIRGLRGGRGREARVPEILLSGDHAKIAAWRNDHSQKTSTLETPTGETKHGSRTRSQSGNAR